MHCADADITHTLLTLTYQILSTHESISHSRNVKHRTLNYSRLTRASLLIGELIQDPVPIPAARARLAAIRL